MTINHSPAGAVTAEARPDLAAAASAWNDPAESLESVNARIHDGVPTDKLHDRADHYIDALFRLFPYIRFPERPTCLEIGSGTGFIMEALNREFATRNIEADTITGLDIAEHMLEKAALRLGRQDPYRYLHYDGIHIPVPDASIDFLYSIAVLQHIPKPYVYNLFFEIKRIVKPTGFAVLQLLSWKTLPRQETIFPWREEVDRQLSLVSDHWHHFYCREELEYVLKIGTGFRYADIREPESIWLCTREREIMLPDDFDPEIYLEHNPDLAGVDPREHWIEHGYHEDRRWK